MLSDTFLKNIYFTTIKYTLIAKVLKNIAQWVVKRRSLEPCFYHAVKMRGHASRVELYIFMHNECQRMQRHGGYISDIMNYTVRLVSKVETYLNIIFVESSRMLFQ